jgi:hypothetical protein
MLAMLAIQEPVALLVRQEMQELQETQALTA